MMCSGNARISTERELHCMIGKGNDSMGYAMLKI